MRIFGTRNRTLMMAVVFLSVFIAAMTHVNAKTQQDLESGALGLTRSQIEAKWGAATEPVEMPGHPIYESTYAYGSEEAMTYVSYRDINGEEVAVYVEFNWFGDGVTEAVARDTVESLLPADAVLTEIYVAPATPDGPIAFVANRYTSDALARAYANILAPEILVIQQEAWNDAAGSSAVMSFSLMLRERTQLTG
jgi:hypothetical protein